tara:strand:+ start:1248 stop:1508 length:261 start_codon:yes stop_codon:yes gene_type:complete
MRNTDITAHGIKEIRIAAVNPDIPDLLKIHIMDTKGNKSKICLFFEDKIDITLDADLPINEYANITTIGDTVERGETINWLLSIGE